MPAQTTIPRNTVDHHNGQNKIFHDRNRFNQYLATNPAYTKHKKEKSNLRKLTTFTKTHDDLTAANPKEGKTHSNITNDEN